MYLILSDTESWPIMYSIEDFSSSLLRKDITPLPTMMPWILIYLFLLSRLFSIIKVARSGMYFPA